VEEKKTGKKSLGVKREFSAGGVVFKKIPASDKATKSGENSKNKFQTLWLIAKSTPSDLYPKSYWRLPKGWLDDAKEGVEPGILASGKRKASEDEIQKAALREVEEEGGVEAKIVKKIGTEKYFLTINGNRILKFVTFYLMEWIKDIPEGAGFETSEVEWLSYEEARKRLKHSSEKKNIR